MSKSEGEYIEDRTGGITDWVSHFKQELKFAYFPVVSFPEDEGKKNLWNHIIDNLRKSGLLVSDVLNYPHEKLGGYKSYGDEIFVCWDEDVWEQATVLHSDYINA